MARKSRKSGTKRKPARATRPRKAASRPARAAVRGSAHPHEEDSVCACDLVFADSEATPDDALPAAIGGVEGEKLRKRAA